MSPRRPRTPRRKLVPPPQPEPRRAPTWDPPHPPWEDTVARVLARLAARRSR